jgi:glycosyltransferase involved in cell wall biosynthesis
MTGARFDDRGRRPLPSSFDLVVTGPSLDLVGGQVRHVLNLRTVADRLGCRFDFVPIGSRPGESGRLAMIRRMARDWLALRRTVAARVAAGAGPVVVHLNGSVQVASVLRELWLAIAARSAGAQGLLVQFHGCLLRAPGDGRWLLRALTRLLVGLADTTVVLAGSQARAIGKSAHRRCLVIPNGIEPLPMRRTFPDGSRPLRIVFVGRVTADKGPDVAVEALAALRREGLHASLTLVGDGDETEATKALARSLGVSQHVRFAGALSPEAVRGELLSHDVMVFPSRVPEGLPYVLLEAMEAGLPVIASVSSEVVAEVVSNASGAIAACDSEGERFAARLAQIAARDDWRAMSEAGRRTIETRYSIASQLRLWRDAWGAATQGSAIAAPDQGPPT